MRTPAESWHALLAPLPDGVVPQRSPAAPAEVLAMPEGSAIAGWEHVVLNLSAGASGFRMVLVVLDETGRAISASDAAVYRREIAEGARSPSIAWRHETLGGRLEPDGTFLGTRWLSTSLEDANGIQHDVRHTPSEPTEAETAGLKALVAEVMRRLPMH
jgi:hypothetical protein